MTMYKATVSALLILASAFFIYYYAAEVRGPKIIAIASKNHDNSIGMRMLYLSTGYYVSKYETTQKQYEQIMGYNPSRSKGKDIPVTDITVTEAMEFCDRLTYRESVKGTLPQGYIYSLPTFEQWKQYLADAPLKGSITPEGKNNKWSSVYPAQVGSGERNKYGIYDLRGNVKEWSSEIAEDTIVILGSSFQTLKKEHYAYPKIEVRVVGGIEVTNRDYGFRCLLVKSDKNPLTLTGDTRLHIAAQNGELEAVKNLMAESINANPRNIRNETPLHRAVVFGRNEVAEYLIHNGADINAQNDLKRTPMHMALLTEDQDMLALLIKNRANIEKRDIWDNTILHEAAKHDMPEIISMMVKQVDGVDIKGQFNWSPLMWAVQYGNIDVVDILIQEGADVNYTANHEYTPLYLAKRGNYPKIIELLKRNGAKEH